MTVDSEKDHSESLGPEAETENCGDIGSACVTKEEPDSTTSDSTSLEADGPDTRW